MRCCIDFCVRNRSIGIQWNLLIRTPSGPAVFSFVERLSSEVIFIECVLQEYFWLVLCWEVCPLLECPLLEVSLYGKGSTQ